MDFVTKDSGERREFATGSKRDTSAGKPRFDLLPVAALKRWADLMGRGADKYGERNWELGQSMARYQESAKRHLEQYVAIIELGGRDAVKAAFEAGRISADEYEWLSVDEDHLAAVLFNVGGLMHHERAIALGLLPRSLDDRYKAAWS